MTVVVTAPIISYYCRAVLGAAAAVAEPAPTHELVDYDCDCDGSTKKENKLVDWNQSIVVIVSGVED